MENMDGTPMQTPLVPVMPQYIPPPPNPSRMRRKGQPRHYQEAQEGQPYHPQPQQQQQQQQQQQPTFYFPNAPHFNGLGTQLQQGGSQQNQKQQYPTLIHQVQGQNQKISPPFPVLQDSRKWNSLRANHDVRPADRENLAQPALTAEQVEHWQSVALNYVPLFPQIPQETIQDIAVMCHDDELLIAQLYVMAETPKPRADSPIPRVQRPPPLVARRRLIKCEASKFVLADQTPGTSAGYRPGHAPVLSRQSSSSQTDKPGSSAGQTQADISRKTSSTVDVFIDVPDGEIDEASLRRDILICTLWDELVRRRSFAQSVDLPVQKVDIGSELHFFLRDCFPQMRMSVIISILKVHDFYTALIICKLATLGERKKLVKENLITAHITTILLPDDQMRWRRQEANEVASIVPDEVAKHWEKFEEIVNTDYTKPFRVDCPVCFTELMESKSIGCTSIAENDDTETDHRFCPDCIKQHAVASLETSIGLGGSGVRCLEHGCKGIILWSRVEVLLNDKEKVLLSNRIDEEAVAAAGMNDVEKCQACPFVCVLELPKEVQEVFVCVKCGHRHCRLCDHVFDHRHYGRKCEDRLNEHDEARKQLEEELTGAMIRKCTCGLAFQKDGGCNKMTCRCGRTQCFVCRLPDVEYKHFGDKRCALFDETVGRRDQQRRRDILADALAKPLIGENIVTALR